MKHVAAAVLFVPALALAVAGCAGDLQSSPFAPSAATSQSVDAATGADAQPATLTGVVRRLNMRTHSFVLASATDTRTDGRVVRMTDRTEVYLGDRRVRPSALKNGLTVEVQGLVGERFITARRITIIRR